MSSGGCSAHPVRYNSPLLQIVMAVWHTFLKFELVGSGVDFNGCLAHFKFKQISANGHYYLQRAATPDQTCMFFYLFYLIQYHHMKQVVRKSRYI
jgi:hypothetical protein